MSKLAAKVTELSRNTYGPASIGLTISSIVVTQGAPKLVLIWLLPIAIDKALQVK